MGVQTSEMVRVPAGTFVRGSSSSPDEQPVVEVRMSSFLIDAMPVTNGDFARFVEAGGYESPRWWTPAGWEFARERELAHPNYWLDPVWNPLEVPVTGVSWWEALAFARFCGKSLPTEAQWEYACRGSDDRTYPWGDEAPTLAHANFAPECEPEDRRPTPPDAHPANVSPFGCVDMSGNFAEWCLDNYSPGYGWEGAAGPDPLYVTREEDEHVVRGGCGLHSDDYLRCAARDTYRPGLRDNLLGFRCVSR
jgi:gamma-glutamyl hercynylcysteine S-oxide synthase